jgi:serine/threonine protein kinase
VLVECAVADSTAQAADSKVQFLKEAAIMAQFNHPNIVSLTGVCTLPETEPTLIVLEYMHLGALHGYLQSPMVKGQLESLTMIRMALDIAAGMQYLSEAGFIVSPLGGQVLGCPYGRTRACTMMHV